MRPFELISRRPVVNSTSTEVKYDYHVGSASLYSILFRRQEMREMKLVNIWAQKAEK